VRDPSTSIATWVAFAGCVLVIAVLYWAQGVLVPIALASLLAFLLAPAVTALQRWVGRVPSVLGVVALTAALFGLAGWGLFRQATSLADELPRYRTNIRQKIADVRWFGRGGTVEKLQDTMSDIKAEMAGPEAPGTPARPVVVAPEHLEDPWGLGGWIGPLLEPLAPAGLVIVLVIFMLLERQELRNRVLGVFGSGTLAVTTRALDEAATRVSRYLFMQSLVNVLFGIGVAVGLIAIGVPYPLLWAMLAATLRFIPYVGPWVGAGTPLLVSLAALPGWQPALLVLALFVVLELFTNLVLEVYLYADAAGVSQVALLIAVAFWTWLWGAPGLLLATPLTVCLVVLGKHVPGLEPIATLMADVPALDAQFSCYQRLLARDYGEAASLVEEHCAAQPPETVYDELLVPALAYAERDRLEQRLTVEDERELVAATRELARDTAVGVCAPARQPAGIDATPRERIAGVAVEADADELALEMLGMLLEATPVAIELAPTRLLSSELVTFLEQGRYRIVCIADLPPSRPSKARYLVRKLRAALPELTIVVGRWAPPALADESSQSLLEAGASHVASTLLETRTELVRIVQEARVSETGDGASSDLGLARTSGDRAGRA
jgi:predicted PurR-regulated permease PerM